MAASDDRVAHADRSVHRQPQQSHEASEVGASAGARRLGLLVAGALWATSLLVYHLITGAEVTESPGMLLAAAAPHLHREQCLVRAAVLASRQWRACRARTRRPTGIATMRSRST